MMYIGSFNDAFLFWLEATVYDSQWVMDCDLLDFLAGAGQ
jgi:hypothetical protein